jgi:hypothetical protein
MLLETAAVDVGADEVDGVRGGSAVGVDVISG